MKIAIPTSDRIKLYKKTGKATEFAICEIVDGSYEFVEFRKNPHQQYEHDAHEHNHKDVVEALKDCDAILAQMVGNQFKDDFNEAGIPIYKTTQTELKEAISVFASNMLGHIRF